MLEKFTTTHYHEHDHPISFLIFIQRRMMKKLLHIFLFITALTCNYATAMELALSLSKTHLIVIPGQNGKGGENVDVVLPYFKQNNLKYRVQIPLEDPNFGQKECQKLLEDGIDDLKAKDTIRNNDNIILHASLQNIAPIITYTAQNHKNIKALILENVMLTGNNTIFHTVDNTTMPKEHHMLNLGNYTVPYDVYLNYSFIDGRTSNNIDQLSDDLPIIIVHDSKNFQSSVKDAQGLYAYLTHIRRNNHVYLFAQDSSLSTINAILKLHNLLPKDSSQQMENLNKYQPAIPREWLDHFYEMLSEKENVESIDASLEETSTNSVFSTIGKFLHLF